LLFAFPILPSFSNRNIDHMNMAHAHAEANNYAIGVKLVRGAYHGQESTRWVAQGNSGPTPVWETKPKTDDCFNASLDWTLDHIKKDVESLKPGVVQAPKVGVLFGTHNVDSCSRVTAGLVSRGLAVVEDGSDEPEHEGLVRVNEEAKKRVMIGQLYGSSSLSSPYFLSSSSPFSSS
jgi:proline dehydrogenase